MDAGAVAGLAVGIDGAAVPHRAERVDAGLHHLAPRLAVQRGDQADAAGIVLRQVDMGLGRQARGLGREAGGEIVGGHASCPPVLVHRLRPRARSASRCLAIACRRPASPRPGQSRMASAVVSSVRVTTLRPSGVA